MSKFDSEKKDDDNYKLNQKIITLEKKLYKTKYILNEITKSAIQHDNRPDLDDKVYETHSYYIKERYDLETFENMPKELFGHWTNHFIDKKNCLYKYDKNFNSILVGFIDYNKKKFHKLN